jgi:hypothetical protein
VIAILIFTEEEPCAVNSNESDENDDEDPIKKYKSLLEDIEKKEDKKRNKDMEMEITWGLGIKDKAEELVKKKLNANDGK